MFTMHYTQPSIEVKIEITEEDTLTLAFAKFVRMCEIVGYQDGSWESLLKEIERGGFQDLSLWAQETMFINEEG